jgi:hypothetical protein
MCWLSWVGLGVDFSGGRAWWVEGKGRQLTHLAVVLLFLRVNVLDGFRNQQNVRWVAGGWASRLAFVLRVYEPYCCSWYILHLEGLLL